MKPGTIFRITLISDARFVNCIDKDLINKSIKLSESINNKGIELYEVLNKRILEFGGEDLEFGEDKQARQVFRLRLTKTLTKNEIYKIINSVEAQRILFEK